MPTYCFLQRTVPASSVYKYSSDQKHKQKQQYVEGHQPISAEVNVHLLYVLDLNYTMRSILPNHLAPNQEDF